MKIGRPVDTEAASGENRLLPDMKPKFTPEHPLRLAMWSGPRNISTAFMRSWGNRDDTFVCDEPLYAHYLVKTGFPHPMAKEVIASQDTDWNKVVAWLTWPVPRAKSILYQQYMSRQLLPLIEHEWLHQPIHLH